MARNNYRKKKNDGSQRRCDEGIAVGNFTETPAQTASWTRQGLRYMSFSVDMGIMYESSRNLVAELRRESGVAG